MIFATVGTSKYPFDRLLAALEPLAGTESVIVQAGASRVRPNGAVCFDYLPPTDFDKYMRQARVIVSHAGVGNVSTALRHGKRPVIVPRLRALNEQVDDHQLDLARQLAALDLATLVEDCFSLADAVARHEPRECAPTGLSRELLADLTSYVESVVHPSRPLDLSAGLHAR
jgi:beta-1,4-N-acetylglucosaminyltransferase